MNMEDWVENNGKNEIPVGERLLLQVTGSKKKQRWEHLPVIGFYDENWGWYLEDEKMMDTFVVEAWQFLPKPLKRERL